EGPPSRGDDVNMGDEGTMEIVSLALKAKAKARAAWALFWAEGTERAAKMAGKWKAVDDLKSPSPWSPSGLGGGVLSTRTCPSRSPWPTWQGRTLQPDFWWMRGWRGPSGSISTEPPGLLSSWPLTQRDWPIRPHKDCARHVREWEQGPPASRFHPKLPFPVVPAPEEAERAPEEAERVPGDRWTGLAGRLMQAQAEIIKMGYLHWLAQLELQGLVEELDAGEADAEGKEKTGEEAKMAERGEEEELVAGKEEEEEDRNWEAERAKSEGDAGREEADWEAGRAKREEEAGGPEEVEKEAKIAKREEGEERREEQAERDTGLSEAFFPLPRGVRPGPGKMAQRKRERMAAKKAALKKMRRG
ncbi:hypothetical protein C0991_001475, partial [Blastosporella zonata]